VVVPIDQAARQPVAATVGLDDDEEGEPEEE
jgi:hypothetical protein